MRHTIVPSDLGWPAARHETAPGADEGPDVGERLLGRSGRAWRLGSAPIGVGGQATVWSARGEADEAVAVKLSHRTAGARAALMGEVELLEALEAAGFASAVRCLDRVEGDGRVGFVMPLYAADLSVHAARVAGSTHPLEAILALAAELARALGGLHAVALPGREGHIVHRDVKPENVLVDGEGRLYLADLAGSLVVDEPTSLALGVFGSPMWAPFDQMLPGLPEPNPTWDTYAVCVMLFWWITGGRPAYQADPSPMLTDAGRVTWASLQALAEASGEGRAADVAVAYASLTRARAGTRAAELVDVRGHAAIQDADRHALRDGVARLAPAAEYGETALVDAARALADLCARGLSPLHHPSPPNRFWDALDLAEHLDAIAARLVTAREGVARRVVAPAPPAPLPARRARTAPALVAAGLSLAMVCGVGLFAAVALWPDAAPPPVSAFIVVPAGTSPHGDTWGDGEEDERPVREVALPAFRIARTEVSHAAYGECVAAGVCSPLAWADPASPFSVSGKGGAAFVGLTGATQLAVGVTWQQAVTWCAWAGGRLPTEEEWEKAATLGATGAKQRWPWGDAAPDCTRANFRDCPAAATLPVDALPAGGTPGGALQLVGNVWEWTSGSYTVVKRALFSRRTQEHKVLRGGAFTSTPAALRPTFRRHSAPEEVSEQVGFRCVLEGEGA